MKDLDLKASACGLLLKTIGIDPSLSGLLIAFKLNPADVFAMAEAMQRDAPGALAWCQKEGPAFIKTVQSFDDRLKRIEMLLACLAAEFNIAVDDLGAVKVIAPEREVA